MALLLGRWDLERAQAARVARTIRGVDSDRAYARHLGNFVLGLGDEQQLQVLGSPTISGGPRIPCTTSLAIVVVHPAPTERMHPHPIPLQVRSVQPGHCASASDEITAKSAPAARKLFNMSLSPSRHLSAAPTPRS